MTIQEKNRIKDFKRKHKLNDQKIANILGLSLSYIRKTMMIKNEVPKYLKLLFYIENENG